MTAEMTQISRKVSVLFYCVAVISACTTTDLLFRVTLEPFHNVVIFHNLTLTCERLRSSSQPTYQWHRSGGDIPMKSMGNGSQQLTIPRVVPSDQGEYYCVATLFGHCAVSNQAKVVVDDQLNISIVSKNMLVNKGETVRFTATASGVGILRYQWKKRGVDNLPDKVSGKNTLVLTIPNIDESDAGKYFCVVTNMWNRSVKSSQVKLNIYGPPTITMHPSIKVVTNNMSIILDCDASGKEPITFKWSNNNINGGQWMTISNSNSRKLIVKNLEESEQFICVASNDAGEARSNIAIISVLKIITHPQNKILQLDSTITFRCTASISSNVIFSWTHNGTSISGSSSTGDTSILTITSVRYSDAGCYVCTVRSGSLLVMSNAATLTPIDPPVITNHPTDNIVPLGKSVTLMCSGCGMGTLKYFWERSSGSSWSTVSNNNVLHTTNTTLAIGQYMYRCRVGNEAGSVVSDNGAVTVYGPPTIKTHPASQLTTVNVKVTLQCKGIGRGSITYQWETSDINERQWMTFSHSNNKRLVVKSLEQSQQYRCVVSNEAGSTRSDIAIITILRIITQPISVVTIALEDSSLNCSASVNDVTYSWHRIGGRVPSRSIGQNSHTLIIPRATPHDNGKYYCTIKKGNISVESNKAVVTVLVNDIDVPIIVIHPTDMVTNASESVTLSCKGTGGGSITYQWETSEVVKDQWKEISNSNGEILVIRNLQKSERYRCIASNEAGSTVSVASTVTLLEIIIHPTSPSTVTALEGATLTCLASVDDVTYSWHRVGSSIPSRSIGHNNNTLTIPRATPYDTGEYYCIAERQGISVESTKAILKVDDHLSINVVPKHLVVGKRNNAQFNAIANGISTDGSNFIYQWRKQGSDNFPDKVSNVNKEVLIIPDVLISDKGQYYCIVTNEWSRSVQSNDVTLNVYDVPEINDHPIGGDAPVNGHFNLLCRASGQGTLIYSWERSSGSSWATVSNDNTTSYTTDTTLAIGQYMYRCRVSNEAGSVVSNITTVNVYGPPTIKTHPASQLTTVSIKVTLQCRGTSRGSITYRWETSNITGGTWMNISRSSSKRLVVRNLEQSQQYRCVVSNKAGTARSDIATITILKITIQPVNSITVTTLKNVTLHCSSSIDDVTYSWHRVDGHIPSHSHGRHNDTLTIHRVTPHDEGMYYCIANKSGISVQSNNASVQVDDRLAISIVTDHSLVNNGGTVQFTATASGIGILRYQWKKRGVDKLPNKVIGDDTLVLRIPDIDGSDEGQYYCVVTNMWNKSVESNQINLTIYVATGPPIIITHPRSQLITSNMSIILDCDASGEELITFKWENSNSFGGQWMTISNSNSRKLIVKNLEESEQKFRCVASNGAGETRSNIAVINVLKIIMQPQNKILKLNSTISFKCTASVSSNVIFLWTHNGTSISGSLSTSDTSILTITSVRHSDAGSYVCTVRSGSLSVMSNAAILAAVASSPSIIQQPDDVNVTVYKSASFSCVAHGFGLVQIVWKRVKYSLPVTADVTEQKSLNEVSSTLTINKIVGYYSGQYYCVAENKAGMVTSQIASLHVQIDQPEIIIPPENVTVLPNHSFNFNCLALSSGVLTYNWSKHDGNLPQAAEKSYIHETFLNSLGGTATLVYNLAVHNVTVSDEGWYCCAATNEGGTTTRCAWLEVNTLPNITMQPESKAIREGELNIIAMSCEVVGIGPVHFQWEKYHTVNNSWIKPSHRAVNTTLPNLKFSEIKEEDEGVYHCIITNNDGNVTSDNATIFVYGPPIIVSISNYSVSLEGDKVNLLCIAINDVHANYSLQINWYKGNELIASNGSIRILIYNEADKTSRQLHSTLLFDPVNHTDNGEYTCRASNHPDTYSELKTNLDVEYAPYVSIVNQSPYMTNVGSVAVLYCRATGKPIPTVQWYEGGFPLNPIPSYFQQVLLIPTDTSHTAVYTCVGTNYAGNKKHTRFANITVIVEDFKPCHSLLEAPENGERTIIKINGFEKHISFRCNSNYALIGESLATCNNGTWSSATPTCKKQQ